MSEIIPGAPGASQLTLKSVSKAYEKWLTADPLQRLRLGPVCLTSHGTQNVEPAVAGGGRHDSEDDGSSGVVHPLCEIFNLEDKVSG